MSADVVVLVPLAQQVEKLLAIEERPRISGEVLLYLNESKMSPDVTIMGATDGVDYFVPVSPQGFILGVDEKTSIAVLDQGLEIIGNLEDFRPSDDLYPVW